MRSIPAVLLVLGMNNIGFAESIMLGASAGNSVQIKAIKRAGTTVFEIQLGGGCNQPPSNTRITGRASTVVGKMKYSGFYQLSTAPTRQLQMKLHSAGKGKDRYSFITGLDVLSFQFAPTSSFTNPWLSGQITSVSAVQQVQDNGDQHPPVLVVGKISAPTGGSLARLFGDGASQLALNVGGNQRLAVLTPGNTLSGMKLENGSKYSPKRNEGSQLSQIRQQ